MNPQAILLDSSFDRAIVGVGSNSQGDVVVIYSNKECIDIISFDGVEKADAIFLMSTFKESSQGKYSPVFLTEMWEME
tara:strand:- start:816 stop:1049 length:234 start_codon:yes stop_codon:yes gene_type:complete